MREAWKRARARPAVVGALAAINLALVIAATTPLSAALKPHLDKQPRAAGWVDGADDAPRLELLQSHPEIVQVSAPLALLVVVLFGIASWILAGGVLGACLDGEPFPIAAARHARRMTALGALGLVTRLPALGALALGWPLGLALASRGWPGVLLAAAATMTLAGFAWSLATVLLDGARGLLLANPERSAWRALIAALRALRPRQKLGALLRLAAFSGGAWLGVTALQLAIGRALPSLAPLLSIFAALARATLTTVVLLASAAAVAHGDDRSQPQVAEPPP